MSILLDALRKSEQQRRLGKAPDIHSPEAVRPAGTGARRRWLVWSVFALAALFLAWIAWRQLGPTAAEPATVAESTAVAGAGDGNAAAADRVPEPSASSPGDNPVVPPRTPVATLASNGGAAADATVPPAEQSEPRKSRVNQSFTEFEASRDTVAGGEPPEVPVAEPQEEVQAARTAAASGWQPSPAASRPAPSDAVAPGPSESRVTEPISFWELPQKIRDSLPDLRITVLVFAERPEDRFLLMGGRRVVEKDQLQDGVVLDEIRRDGAVFTYRNYRFLVKG